MPPRPTRINVAAVVLVLTAVLALAFAALQVVGYAGSAEYDGIATRMGFFEYVLDAPDQTVLPVALAITAGAAAYGLRRGLPWGRALAGAVGVLFLAGAIKLAVTAIAEWGLPGSFSAFLIPPAVVATLIGGYLVWAALTSATSTAEH
jgi:hypothetical protein